MSWIWTTIGPDEELAGCATLEDVRFDHARLSADILVAVPEFAAHARSITSEFNCRCRHLRRAVYCPAA
jgi:hypothetical protein